MAEGEVLELVAHLLDAHAAGERRVDVERLLGDALALVGRHEAERAHVVQPVGELDQQHAHVGGDREQELAEVLALRGALRDEVEARRSWSGRRRARRSRGPKLRLISSSVASVSSIVSCRTAATIVASSSLQVGQDRRDLERMGEDRPRPRRASAAMRVHGVDIGAVEEVLVGVGVVAAHPLDELVLPHHAAALGLCGRALGRRRETADGRPCRCLGQRRLFQLNDWHISRILACAR